MSTSFVPLPKRGDKDEAKTDSYLSLLIDGGVRRISFNVHSSMSIVYIFLSILAIVAVLLILLLFCFFHVAVELKKIRASMQTQNSNMMQEIEILKNYQAGVYNAAPRREGSVIPQYSSLHRETEIQDTYHDIQLISAMQENKQFNNGEEEMIEEL